MAENKNDLLEKIMEHGVDTRARIVYIDDEVDEKLYRRVTRCLKMLDRTDGQITIVLNCPGGSVTDGFGIYGAIRRCRNTVKIIVEGCAMSMGSIIMQAGDIIQMDEDAVVMIHFGEISLHDHSKNVKRAVEENERQGEWMIDLFVKKIRQKKPRYSRQQFEEDIMFDRYYTAKEALKLGLIDEII